MAQTQEQLLAVLDDLRVLLAACGEDRWVAWTTRSAKLVHEGNPHGVKHLMQAYGGMGSFTDLALSPSNGHHIQPDDVVSVNPNLDRLRTRAFRIAADIKRRQQGPRPGSVP